MVTISNRVLYIKKQNYILASFQKGETKSLKIRNKNEEKKSKINNNDNDVSS